eukprot:355754-Chlamydomonas_euryale.AAC.19
MYPTGCAEHVPSRLLNWATSCCISFPGLHIAAALSLLVRGSVREPPASRDRHDERQRRMRICNAMPRCVARRIACRGRGSLLRCYGGVGDCDGDVAMCRGARASRNPRSVAPVQTARRERPVRPPPPLRKPRQPPRRARPPGFESGASVPPRRHDAAATRLQKAPPASTRTDMSILPKRAIHRENTTHACSAIRAPLIYRVSQRSAVKRTPAARCVQVGGMFARGRRSKTGRRVCCVRLWLRRTS